MEHVELQRKKTIMQEKEQLRQQKETPFRPQISPMKNRHGPLTARHREKQKKFGNQWDYLHSESLMKSKTFKKDKTRDEIELEREANEYTFQPNKGNSNTSPRQPKRKAQNGNPFSQAGKQIQISVNIGG